MTDLEYMELALSLAKKGAGAVNPNPMVGAVIVKNGKIIGQGYHMKYGDLHAERNAIASCTESPEGATIYVTLEPCCHYGKTPPCTEAIIDNKISRVVIGSSDPNPLVAGKGVKILENAGISVTEGILKEECDKLNRVFFHYIKTKTPYVVMKYAMTADGKIAAYTGESKWITGEEARAQVHRDRNRYSAIMIGIGTLLRDDPLLTCRLPSGNGRNPIRIICDSKLRTPLDSQVVKTAHDIRTIIATCNDDSTKYEPYQAAGCEILALPTEDGHIHLPSLMTRLGEMSIDSILLEGGGELNWSALNSGIVQRVQVYIAPKILGGATAKSPVAGLGAPSPNAAVYLSQPEITRFGKDILLESEVLPCLQES